MNKNLKKDLLIYFLIFGLLTLPFLFFDIDMACQRPYYESVKGWFLSELPFWDFIYKYGIFLGYFLAVAALVMVSVSYWKKSAIKWRKASYFMLFVMIIGPGILANGTFKEHWGRPRPREIKEFNGTENYVKVWVKGDTNGKSFPCGHATMGFYLAIPFLFLRKNYKKWAWGVFTFGTLYGLLIGYARMVAGGHFASDVLWAAGMVWLPGIVGYYLLKVDKEVDLDAIDIEAQKRKGKIITILMGLVLPILTLSLLLATPYISTREYSQTRENIDKLSIKKFEANFSDGVIHTTFGNDFTVKFSVQAFGFPNSKIGWDWVEGDTTSFTLIHMGWFTEVRNTINLSFPSNTEWENHLNLKEGKIYIEIPNDTLPKNLTISVDKGDVVLAVDELSELNLSSETSSWENPSNLLLFDASKSAAQITVSIAQGKLTVEEKNN